MLVPFPCLSKISCQEFLQFLFLQCLLHTDFAKTIVGQEEIDGARGGRGEGEWRGGGFLSFLDLGLNSLGLGEMWVCGVWYVCVWCVVCGPGVCCSVLQCVTVCCSVLQCVAVCGV